MTKRIETPQPEETVTIPRSSFDNIFRAMEDMKQEIASLKQMISSGNQSGEIVFSSIEAADYCGRTRQTIYAWTRQKRIHKVIRGAKRGYLKSELDKIREL